MFEVLYFFLGASLGSFINVVRMRIGKGESFIIGRSRCDTCSHILYIKDLVPLLSFFCLRGRCRYCGAPIGLRHLWMEVAGGVIMVMGMKASDPFIPCQFLLCLLLLYIAVSDIETLTISDAALVGIFLCRIIDYFLLRDIYQLTALIPGVIFSLSILLFSLCFHKSFGLGDGLLLAALSFGKSWHFIMCFLLSTLWSGGACALILLLKGADHKTAIPFVPFIVFGYYVAGLI